MERDKPIFFDATGKRWKRLKLWTALILLFLCGFIVLEAYRIGSLEEIGRLPDASINADQLTDTMSRVNTPIIGEGPLARVIKVKNGVAREIYRNTPSRTLSPENKSIVGDYPYAIERYGGSANGKRLVLTFDDGPDIIYTQQLLNVLSEQGVPATFFVVGKNVVEHPEIIKRIVREGHGLANHSFTHADFEVTPTLIAEQEINLTRRAIRAVSGYDTVLVRPPYAGGSDQSLRNSLHGILHAQRLGQTVALYTYDTNDWQHRKGSVIKSMPEFDGRDHVLLLHDGGGDRAATIEYVKSLIAQARRSGYSFAAMHSLYPSEKTYFQPGQIAFEDWATVAIIEAFTVWPLRIAWVLFTITILFVFVSLFLYITLAFIQNRRTRSDAVLEKSNYQPSVTVIVPAYNEEKVLESCVDGLLRSRHRKLRICIVDDGSSDQTWRIARRLAATHDNVRSYRQRNAGKAAAINTGIKRTRSPVIIGIDADTMFMPDTVSRLARHFQDPRVGAVAGMVRIVNRSNIITRCQALEYATSICLERTAQACLGAITVVPGACGAWRRSALVDAGRYSSETLAEDCDMTLSVHYAGYQIIQDNTAISYTEVPMNITSFARQRFRWAFGHVQVFWKYKTALVNRESDWLNSFVLPLSIMSTVGPVFFLPFLGLIAAQNILAGNYMTLLLFSLLALVFQLIRAGAALALGHERMSYLWMVPMARLLYGPLRVYLIYGTVLRAIQGSAVGWNKLTRVGLSLPPSQTSRESVKI